MNPSTGRRIVVAAIATALLITAQLAAAPAAEPPAAPPDTEPPAHALAHEPCGEADAACAAAAETARADLAAHLDVAPERIELLRQDRVTWNSGSLGCPQPGRMYTQAVVAGVFIELRAAGVSYRYHAGRSGAPFLCEQPEPATGDGAEHG